jgi:pimeloyl-ACP methyl ester carboxylesterase
LFWLWLAIGVVFSVPLVGALFFLWLYFKVKRRYLPFVVRVFQEKPPFLVPRGQPVRDAEDVRFLTSDGLTLCGCYLHTTLPVRRGVVLFGLEFGSTRWASVPYCQFLIDNGYDVFAFEPRGQGQSDPQLGYEPAHWVTDYEVRDTRAAVAYLKSRRDADPRGVGFFGISKGGGAGLLAASTDPRIRCCVTDGAFATRSTMVPYMVRWAALVNIRPIFRKIMPRWFYEIVAETAMREVQRDWNCRFPSLERALPCLAPRPLLLIHGGNDTYIKPEMAQELFRRARQPKELWLVAGARHNQALQVAGPEYRDRILSFFDTHLAARDGEGPKPSAAPCWVSSPSHQPVPLPAAASAQPLSKGV